MSSDGDIDKKIEVLCSYVCNGKTYGYEQKLYLAVKHGLYDAAVIYAWNIFMLFIYEKLWQLREIEKEAGTPYKSDKIFLDALTSNKPDDYFDGHLCALGKLQTECKQGEDAIVGKLRDVYKNVDQQYFRKAQGVLQKRNEKAHVNSLGTEKEDLEQVLRELIQICAAVQSEHNGFVTKIFELLDKKGEWHISDQDMQKINTIFSASGSTIDKLKYIYVTSLISQQEFSSETTKIVKDQAIAYFLESKGFRTSEENAQLLIKPLVAILNKEDVIKILNESFNNDSHGYNQILQAGGIEDIFLELYTLSKNNFPELEENWLSFITRLETVGYHGNFANLIGEIRNQSGEINDIE